MNAFPRHFRVHTTRYMSKDLEHPILYHLGGRSSKRLYRYVGCGIFLRMAARPLFWYQGEGDLS